MSKKEFNTRLIHGGSPYVTGAREVIIPIYTSATFKQKSFSDHSGYGYARGQNPTRESLETLFADLENAQFGFAFASGMSAIDGALHVFAPGDEILVPGNVYGGTDSLLRVVYGQLGIKAKEIIVEETGVAGEYNAKVIDQIKASITPAVRGIFFETPSNPTLSVLDIRQVAEAAKENGLITILDNTFSSPYLQRPLDLGIDIVVESATKYIGGHSDVIAGLAATNSEALAQKLSAAQHLAGGITSPFDAYQLVKSIKTLSVRMDRQVENAEKIAAYLDANEAVDLVHYPGLAKDPGYEIQKRQAKNGGAMLAFLLNEKYDVGRFLDALEVITQGASLGGVESLIGHSATTSHREVPVETRQKLGITDNLIRLSVGIEDVKDLIDDLEQAFHAAKK